MVISASYGDGGALACARLADALEGMPEGILLIDARGRLAAANARMAELLPAVSALLQPGIAAARLVCATARALAPGGSHQMLRALRARLLAVENGADEICLPTGRWLRLRPRPAGDGGWMVTVADITDAKACDAALSDCRIVLDNLALGFCLYAPDATVRFVNARYGEVLGVDQAMARPGATMRELLAASVAAGHHGERSLQVLEQLCLDLVAARQPRRLVITLATGRLVGFEHTPLEDGGWLATFEDITERQGLRDQATFLARHDALTQLPNRAVLGERLEHEIAATGRGSRFALLCVNLDHFKSINDTLGHAVGDALLRAVAERLSASVRETDCVCRLGGDEFAIIQTGLGRAELCAEQAQRLMQAFAVPFHLESHRIVVGISIGIAVAPEDGSHAEALLRHADSAMDRAKKDGGGTYRLFERTMDARLQARRAMEVELRQALAENTFELHFQPLVDITAGVVAGFEALLRWRHPSRGMVPPAEFIPLAEDIGLIVPLGDWVLRTACKIAASWPGAQRVAVNVSPVQVKAGLLPGAVALALAESGLPAKRLELEITESVLLSNNAATLDLLRGLRAKGVRISMDDFGTGYSSLSYLRSFPFDKIKIDQSFVRDLEESADSAAIVAAIVGLGRSLGMRVTAEGVETAAQLARLRAAGCDEVQGYLFSRPRPAADLALLIAQIEAEAVSA